MERYDPTALLRAARHMRDGTDGSNLHRPGTESFSGLPTPQPSSAAPRETAAQQKPSDAPAGTPLELLLATGLFSRGKYTGSREPQCESVSRNGLPHSQ